MVRKRLERALRHLKVYPLQREGELVLALSSKNDGVILFGIYQNRIEGELDDDELCTINEAQRIAKAVIRDSLSC